MFSHRDAIMNSRIGSHRSTSIKFALLQKGKSPFVKVSYESPSDMLLAQNAWQQVQQHYINMVPALKCIDPPACPEWHKNGATLRLPDGQANAIQLLTAVAREFECCVHKQLARAEEKDYVFASALLQETVLGDTAPSPAPNPVPRREPVPQRRVPAAERRALILAPYELIKTAEAFGLQRLHRYFFPFQRQVVSVPPRTLTPSPSLPLSPCSPPDSSSPSSVSASASDTSLHPQSPLRSVHVPRAAPAHCQCALERTALTSGVLLRVLCFCATAAAAARQLAAPPPKHGACRSVQFRWAEFVLRHVFWGSRRRIQVCPASCACDHARSLAHACCSKIWTLSKFVASFSIYPLLITLVTFSFDFDFLSLLFIQLSCLFITLSPFSAARCGLSHRNERQKCAPCLLSRRCGAC